MSHPWLQRDGGTFTSLSEALKPLGNLKSGPHQTRVAQRAFAEPNVSGRSPYTGHSTLALLTRLGMHAWVPGGRPWGLVEGCKSRSPITIEKSPVIRVGSTTHLYLSRIRDQVEQRESQAHSWAESMDTCSGTLDCPLTYMWQQERPGLDVEDSLQQARHLGQLAPRISTRSESPASRRR